MAAVYTSHMEADFAVGTDGQCLSRQSGGGEAVATTGQCTSLSTAS